MSLSRPPRTAALLLALGLPALGCSALTTAASAEPGPGDTNSPFWVDPASPAAQQLREWRRQGRFEDAALIRRIAEQPIAAWPGGDRPAGAVRRVVRAASAAGRTAVLVAYRIPHRDCGQHSAGGARDARRYLEWIGEFARGIGDARAVVVLEPDAVAHNVAGCTPPKFRAERERLLGAAVDRLGRQPHTRVYLDAGNPGWIKDPADLAGPLRRSGLARADGFALNVSNFHTDAANRTYGHRLSKLTGGKHYLTDTSRNGRGPLPGKGDTWCNPPGRALGRPPTTDTGDPLLDAHLWVKRPGESDGKCRGGPAAGTWWAEYALGLARNTGPG